METRYNFAQVLELLKSGEKVTLPEWAGYWSIKNGVIMANLADGSVAEATHFQRNVFRDDWTVFKG